MRLSIRRKNINYRDNEETICSDIINLPYRFGNSFAQTLKGHIYDANTNEPLVGAAVTYKLHGNQGTVSDINGAYEIKLPEEASILYSATSVTKTF